MSQWFALSLNPEPWAVGPLSIGRRGGKVFATMGRNAQLHAFKEAVKEEIAPQDPVMIEGPVSLTLYFWRQRADYQTPQARTARKHEADLTNLQKSIEDALQGILYKNDRDVVEIYSVLMEQSPETIPHVIVHARRSTGLDPAEARFVKEMRDENQRFGDTFESTYEEDEVF